VAATRQMFSLTLNQPPCYRLVWLAGILSLIAECDSKGVRALEKELIGFGAFFLDRQSLWSRKL
jgi:hypothetical protein